MEPNRKHKSSVFSQLFNNPEAARELYSAIEGVQIPPDMPIEINTLSDALIRGQLNDVSFIIDNRLVFLVEHQSTPSENFPIRLLDYIALVFRGIIDFEKKYQRKLEKIPKPEFIVLYNGNELYPEHKILRLSDAFIDIHGLKLSESEEPPLELIVNVYNINQGFNQKILKKSVILEGYSILISKIWENRNNKKTLEESLEHAIKYCITNNILKDFLMKNGSEVYSWLYGEYNIEDEIAVVKREAREDGFAEGQQEKKEEILDLIDQGLTTEEIKQRLTGA